MRGGEGTRNRMQEDKDQSDVQRRDGRKIWKILDRNKPPGITLERKKKKKKTFVRHGVYFPMLTGYCIFPSDIGSVRYVRLLNLLLILVILGAGVTQSVQ